MRHKILGVIVLSAVLAGCKASDTSSTDMAWKEAYIECLEQYKDWDIKVDDNEKSEFFLHDLNQDGTPELIIEVHRGVDIYTFDSDSQEIRNIFSNGYYSLHLSTISGQLVFEGYLGGNKIGLVLYEIDKDLNMTQKESLLTGSNMANYDMSDYYRNGEAVSENVFDPIFTELRENRIRPDMFLYAHEKVREGFNLEDYIYKP